MAIPVYEALSADANQGNLTRLLESDKLNTGDRPKTKFEVAVRQFTHNRFDTKDVEPGEERDLRD
jgi:hypothetical protein